MICSNLHEAVSYCRRSLNRQRQTPLASNAKKRERQHFARVLTFGPRGSIFRFRNAGGLPRRMSSALGRYLRRDPNGSSRLLTG